jgi:pyridoxine 5-phosphate synthase
VKRLGVNIDHIATLRNARGEFHPNPVKAAKFVQRAGADSITIHLREDRRHINDNDAKKICSINNLLVNLEISTNPEIVKIALKIRPNYICIVPENRKEITTEGGLNLKRNKIKIKNIISLFKKKNIRTSLFIDPNIEDVKISKEIKSDCIEIHTGRLANLIKSKKKYLKELNRVKKCSKKAKEIGLEVHAGHGLDYKTTKILTKINQIEEFNIGHYLIGESIFFGLSKVIKNFKKILKK